MDTVTKTNNIFSETSSYSNDTKSSEIIPRGISSDHMSNYYRNFPRHQKSVLVESPLVKDPLDLLTKGSFPPYDSQKRSQSSPVIDINTITKLFPSDNSKDYSSKDIPLVRLGTYDSSINENSENQGIHHLRNQRFSNNTFNDINNGGSGLSTKNNGAISSGNFIHNNKITSNVNNAIEERTPYLSGQNISSMKSHTNRFRRNPAFRTELSSVRVARYNDSVKPVHSSMSLMPFNDSRLDRMSDKSNNSLSAMQQYNKPRSIYPSIDFWFEDPSALFQTFDIIPTNNMTDAERLNAMTRVIIIIAAIMFVVKFPAWWMFLIIGIIVVIILWYIIKSREQIYADHMRRQTEYLRRPTGGKKSIIRPINTIIHPINLSKQAHSSYPNHIVHSVQNQSLKLISIS